MAVLDFSEVGYTISSPVVRGNFIEYTVTNGNVNKSFLVAKELDQDEEALKKIESKISLILFHQVGIAQDWRFESLQQANKFTNELLPRISPKEKMNLLLEYLHSLASFDGELVELETISTEHKNSWRKLFFNSEEEYAFYSESLQNKKWIEVYNDGGPYFRVGLTMDGLTEVGNYLESKNSNVCFVAMSFDATLTEIYTNAIRPAIVETGFVPFILNNENIETGQTINDAMIAALKKAKFTIADFTQHKGGVYFEAGYALGRGQKVIYTCREDDIKNAHFDTRNYQHLLWKDAADLKQKLIDKIEAFIKD